MLRSVTFQAIMEMKKTLLRRCLFSDRNNTLNALNTSRDKGDRTPKIAGTTNFLNTLLLYASLFSRRLFCTTLLSVTCSFLPLSCYVLHCDRDEWDGQSSQRRLINSFWWRSKQTYKSRKRDFEPPRTCKFAIQRYDFANKQALLEKQIE